jgi:hypothetical protein
MAGPACALSLGDAAVRSKMGEALDVRFPVKIERGESIEPSCFQLGAGGAADAPHLASGSVSLERSAAGTTLRLRSAVPVTDPALAVEIVANCPGQGAPYRREYTLRIDAKGGAAPAVAPTSMSQSAPSPAASSPMLPSIATLIARIGDTLESIAEAIFPKNRAAKRSYIEALRTSNPPLANLRDSDPIPVDTPIALPDLRAFSQQQRAARTHPERAPAPPPEARHAQAPASPAARAPAAKPTPEAPAPRAKRPAKARAEAPAPRLAASPAPRPAAAPASPVARGDFVLKLSSPEVDLSRSRGIDEKSRAQLRERLTILDADDQVAALLALRHSVKQLETQVADLQLKLSGMPSSFPPPRAEPAPERAKPQAEIAKPQPEATKPQPEAAKPQPEAVKPGPEPAPVPPPVVPAPQPQSEAKPAEIPPPAPVTSDISRPRPALPGMEPPTPWMDYGLWALAVVFLLAAILLAVRLVRRARESRGWAEEEEAMPEAADAAAAEPDDSIIVADEPMEDMAPPPGVQPARREIDSDVALPTRLPSNTEDLRQRYIEERFPEIGKGAIVLDDPDSVVKGARLFYEDGALARAVELLHYAIERHPGELKAWLALFEIYRLEGLSGEFAQLAARFKEQHGKSDYWRKVQYFGREIDPGNALYAAAPIDSFQTIGPAQARRIAADSTTVDPIAENWLGAPMDFENEVLANELRKTLMADYGINEQDLVPNPMPALRNVEMFSVA